MHCAFRELAVDVDLVVVFIFAIRMYNVYMYVGLVPSFLYAL